MAEPSPLPNCELGYKMFEILMDPANKEVIQKELDLLMVRDESDIVV